MRIAQVAPLYESVPPKYYGGSERVVSYLTEALVDLGHEVTLYATGDSVTNAQLRPACDRPLRQNQHCIDRLAHHLVMMEHVYQRAFEFDIIHNHNDYVPFSLARRCQTPTVTTLHGRLDIEDLKSIYQEFDDMPVISISNAQRMPLPHIHWVGNVYHGLPPHLYTYSGEQGKYLAFIGRISPEKRVDTAIEIATQVEMPLKIAAKVDKVDEQYFEIVIKPLLKHPLIDYIGEIGEGAKSDFLMNAYALLFPIDWPEPFGLAMIESLACGTPVIARRRGSVPEVIQDAVTGFVIENTTQAVEAVKKVSEISRKRCREVFEEKFTNIQMTQNYMNIYKNVLQAKRMK